MIEKKMAEQKVTSIPQKIRKAEVYVQDQLAGILEETHRGKKYLFTYLKGYLGSPVSLTLPVQEDSYEFGSFPPFFEGLLPEGFQLEALLRQEKIDRTDYFSQLVSVGSDLVGDVTIRGIS